MRFKNNKNDPFTLKEGGIKDGKIEGFSYHKSWAEDAYLEDAAHNTVRGNVFSLSKLKYVYVGFLFFVIILIGRIAWLQIVKGDYYLSMAEGNRIRAQRIEPKRGVIYDRNGLSLVKNVANFMLYFIPADLPDDENDRRVLVKQIADLLGDDINEIQIEEILSAVNVYSLEAYQPLFIADNIGYEKAMLLHLRTDGMPGVILSNQTRREYNNLAKSMSHIMGYTGKINKEEYERAGDDYLQIDYIGKMGVEYFWESELRGSSGSKHIEVDAMGKEKKIISVKEPVDGNNLILSIDVNLQKKTEQILLKYLEEMKLSNGTVIIMDPDNGEILTMVSMPVFDNNMFARGIKQGEYSELINNPGRPLFFRAVSGEFPSGSTIKPLMASAALQERIISEHTTFLSTGGIRIGQWFFPDWRSGGHGRIDVKTAIAQSVNTFFYYIGGGYEDFVGLGVDKIGEYLRMFGLGVQTGVDLAGEASGFVPTKEWKEEAKKERWYIGDTYHLAIGQGDLLVTPLQVANYTCFFANGGKLYRPHLVRYVLSENDKRVVSEIDNRPVRSDFIDDYNIQVVRRGMRQTAISGSARRLNALSVTSAGKTGTAQWSTQKAPHAWYTGFAPYEDPEIVITILVEEGEEGSAVGVSIAKDVLAWYFDEYKKVID